MESQLLCYPLHNVSSCTKKNRILHTAIKYSDTFLPELSRPTAVSCRLVHVYQACEGKAVAGSVEIADAAHKSINSHERGQLHLGHKRHNQVVHRRITSTSNNTSCIAADGMPCGRLLPDGNKEV